MSAAGTPARHGAARHGTARCDHLFLPHPRAPAASRAPPSPCSGCPAQRDSPRGLPGPLPGPTPVPAACRTPLGTTRLSQPVACPLPEVLLRQLLFGDSASLPLSLWVLPSPHSGSRSEHRCKSLPGCPRVNSSQGPASRKAPGAWGRWGATGHGGEELGTATPPWGEEGEGVDVAQAGEVPLSHSSGMPPCLPSWLHPPCTGRNIAPAPELTKVPGTRGSFDTSSHVLGSTGSRRAVGLCRTILACGGGVALATLTTATWNCYDGAWMLTRGVQSCCSRLLAQQSEPSLLRRSGRAPRASFVALEARLLG